NSRPRRGVPEPAVDVAVDGLGPQPLLADALQQHLPRHLPLAEAGDLDALRQIVGRVLDGVVNVMRRHLNREADAIVRQLLERRRHAVHSSSAAVMWAEGLEPPQAEAHELLRLARLTNFATPASPTMYFGLGSVPR